jgi:hypothetical protein
MWPFVVKHAPDAKRLLDIEPWYVAGGMAIRVIALAALLTACRSRQRGGAR